MNPRHTLMVALAALLAGLMIKTFVAEPVYVASGSMEPTLRTGVYLLNDKLTLRFRKPERGEIIAFASPVGERHDSIKRVIAIGGDRIAIKDKKVLLNGAAQYEPYAQYLRGQERLVGDNMPEIAVPDGELFVLGDNRDESYDSATWKNKDGERIYFIPVSSVTGKLRGAYRKY